jgi:hypothetical protein
MALLAKAAGSRVAKTYTIEPEVDSYISTTKGQQSESRRANDLLKKAIIQEQYDQLEREAAAFFATETSRTGTHAFQKASKRTLERD